MPDGELDAFAIHHFQRLALRVVPIGIQHRTAAEDRSVLDSPHDHFRLEDPRGILVLLRLRLIVHEENRHEPVALRQFGTHGSLHEHLRAIPVDGERFE